MLASEDPVSRNDISERQEDCTDKWPEACAEIIADAGPVACTWPQGDGFVKDDCKQSCDNCGKAVI